MMVLILVLSTLLPARASERGCAHLLTVINAPWAEVERIPSPRATHAPDRLLSTGLNIVQAVDARHERQVIAHQGNGPLVEVTDLTTFARREIQLDFSHLGGRWGAPVQVHGVTIVDRDHAVLAATVNNFAEYPFISGLAVVNLAEGRVHSFATSHELFDRDVIRSLNHGVMSVADGQLYFEYEDAIYVIPVAEIGRTPAREVFDLRSVGRIDSLSVDPELDRVIFGVSAEPTRASEVEVAALSSGRVLKRHLLEQFLGEELARNTWRLLAMAPHGSTVALALQSRSRVAGLALMDLETGSFKFIDGAPERYFAEITGLGWDGRSAHFSALYVYEAWEGRMVERLNRVTPLGRASRGN